MTWPRADLSTCTCMAAISEFHSCTRMVADCCRVGFAGRLNLFCRTSGERIYCHRIQTFLQTNTVISADFGVTSALLCLSQRVPSDFRFLPHGRVGCGRLHEIRSGVHTQYNSYVCQVMRWMEKTVCCWTITKRRSTA